MDLLCKDVKSGASMPMLIGLFLLGLCFFLVFGTSFLFYFGVTVTALHLPAAILLSAAMCFFLSGKAVKKTLIAAAVGLALMGAAIAANIYITEVSWDGNAYHKPMAAYFRYGWNPVRETYYEFTDRVFPLLSPYRSNYLDAYPKASEIIAGCIYRITGNLETGKAFNLIALMSALCICEAYLTEAAGLKTWQAWICAGIFTINPVSVAQVFVFYNDGFLWQMVLLCTIGCLYLVFFEQGRYRRISLFLIFAAINIGFNIKFSGVIFFALPCAALFCLWAIRTVWKQWTGQRIKKVLQGGAFFAASVFSGFALSGSASYVVNTFRHKNPFYTIFGPGANDIIESMVPADLKACSDMGRLWKAMLSQNNDKWVVGYKPPFLFSSASVQAQGYDTVYGGWGILFGDLLILGLLILAVVWACNLRKRPLLCRVMELFACLGLLSGAVVPGLWWPRYFAAPLYVPACAVLALFMAANRGKTLAPFAAGGLAMLCLINVSPDITRNMNVLDEYEHTRYELDRMKAISNRAPVGVTFDGPYDYTFYGHLFELIDNDITNYYYIPEYSGDMRAVEMDIAMYYRDPDTGVWAAEDLASYIEQVREMEDVALVISVKDEASSALTDEIVRAMQELGLEFDMKGRYRQSYIAVVDEGTVLHEEYADRLLSYEGKVGKTSVSVQSGGYTCGNIASVCVDGKEYAVNMRGVNMVLIDRKTDTVIDSVAFDTYAGGPCVRQ